MNILTDAKLRILESYTDVADFNCNDKHVNKFFRKKAVDADSQLLSRSYLFVSNESIASDKEDRLNVVGAYCLSCDSVNVLILPDEEKSAFQDRFPRGKGYSSYPAIKIGQLGVNGSYQHKGLYIGSQILEFVKSKALLDYGALMGCRFIVLDSINKPENIRFYKRNGFRFLLEDENQEKEAYHKDMSQELSTRLMYFDLMNILLCQNAIEALKNNSIQSEVKITEGHIKDNDINEDILIDDNKDDKLEVLNPIQCVAVSTDTDMVSFGFANKDRNISLTIKDSEYYGI